MLAVTMLDLGIAADLLHYRLALVSFVSNGAKIQEKVTAKRWIY